MSMDFLNSISLTTVTVDSSKYVIVFFNELEYFHFEENTFIK